MSVEDYIAEFDNLMLKGKLQEVEKHTIAQTHHSSIFVWAEVRDFQHGEFLAILSHSRCHDVGFEG